MPGRARPIVLAYRVIRLLLAGADPGRILCLTFTRAAAAEMAKRVFDILAKWTAMPDYKLATAIREIEGRKPDAATLAEARRLFARALETPGGLKIQTIHAFCERLLHQFPFEANVAGHFEVLDQRDAEALAVLARQKTLAKAAEDADGPLGRALHDALAAASDFMVERAMTEFINGRDRLRRWLAQYGSLDDALLDLQQAFGLDGHEDPDNLWRSVVGILPSATISRNWCGGCRRAVARRTLRRPNALRRLSPPRRSVRRDRPILHCGSPLRATCVLRSVTNAVKKDWPGLAELLDAERERLDTLLERIRGAETFHATAAILRLADRAIAEYERMKTARGALDFEDLVVKTVALLSRADAARWVHYKLDRGLQHILVDEAQDTSPRQWQVVQALAEEFFAGDGASDGIRTIFAVGDEKQSIYSFQGAVPSWFSRMRGQLGDRARRAGLGWKEPQLHLSFRSVPAILCGRRHDLRLGEGLSRPLLRARAAGPFRGPAESSRPGRAVADDPAARKAGAGRLGEPGRPSRRTEPRGPARQPHCRHRRRLAAARGAARIDRRADPARRHPHPLPDPRRADRRHQPRAQDP